jgi:tripartite-type tricarboxylate transporter receptor subunit TctC
VGERPELPAAPARHRCASARLVVRSYLGIKTAQVLIAYAKKNLSKLNHDRSGNSNSSGTFITHVTYHGFGPTVIDLLASQIDITDTTAPSQMPHV